MCALFYADASHSVVRKRGDQKVLEELACGYLEVLLMYSVLILTKVKGIDGRRHHTWEAPVVFNSFPIIPDSLDPKCYRLFYSEKGST